MPGAPLSNNKQNIPNEIHYCQILPPGSHDDVFALFATHLMYSNCKVISYCL